MKKLIAMLLALMMVISLAACAGNTTVTDDETKPSQTENKPEEDNTPEDLPEEEPEEDLPEDDNTTEEELSFEEVVVLDDENCLIKITGIDPDNMWGYTLKAYFENKSADKTYTFAVHNATINGVQSDPFFATEIAPGKKSNESISFMDTDLADIIGDYTDIMLTIDVSDSEDWLADPVAVVEVHVYPYGEDKAVRFVREAQDTDQILLDNEYVTLIATGTTVEEDWSYGVDMYLVNKTDKNLMFSVENTSVNGFMCEPFFAQSVYAGNCAFSSMDWMLTDLAENDITTVEEIEFTLTVYDEDNWDTPEFVNEVIKFAP